MELFYSTWSTSRNILATVGSCRRKSSSCSSILHSSLELSDTKVYVPQIRALLGAASHLCAEVVRKLRDVSIGAAPSLKKIRVIRPCQRRGTSWLRWAVAAGCPGRGVLGLGFGVIHRVAARASKHARPASKYNPRRQRDPAAGYLGRGVLGLGLRVEGVGFRVKGFRFRVSGLG